VSHLVQKLRFKVSKTERKPSENRLEKNSEAKLRKRASNSRKTAREKQKKAAPAPLAMPSCSSV